MLKRILIGGAAAVAVIFIALQFVPVSGRANPPVEADLEAPAEVKTILRRSCYDCHSHETRWPWYNRVAPASWLVARDVEEGRKHLNFSRWGVISSEARAEKLGEIREEIDEGEMPLWFYVPLHPEAKLSDADKSLIHDWTRAAAIEARGIEGALEDAVRAAGAVIEDAGRAAEAAFDGAAAALDDASADDDGGQNRRPGGRDE